MSQKRCLFALDSDWVASMAGSYRDYSYRDYSRVCLAKKQFMPTAHSRFIGRAVIVQAVRQEACEPETLFSCCSHRIPIDCLHGFQFFLTQKKLLQGLFSRQCLTSQKRSSYAIHSIAVHRRAGKQAVGQKPCYWQGCDDRQ